MYIISSHNASLRSLAWVLIKYPEVFRFSNIPTSKQRHHLWEVTRTGRALWAILLLVDHHLEPSPPHGCVLVCVKQAEPQYCPAKMWLNGIGGQAFGVSQLNCIRKQLMKAAALTVWVHVAEERLQCLPLPPAVALGHSWAVWRAGFVFSFRECSCM